MNVDTPRGRALYFIEEIWPRVMSFDDPWRDFKTVAYTLALDVLDLTTDDCTDATEVSLLSRDCSEIRPVPNAAREVWTKGKPTGYTVADYLRDKARRDKAQRG